MIYSMTGYGKADASYNGKKIHIEVKSLNSKNLDLSTRIPSIYREKEMDIRKLVAGELERGKIELTIWCEKGTEQAGLTINPSAVASYLQQMQTISIETPGLAMPNPSELWKNGLLYLQLFLKPSINSRISVAKKEKPLLKSSSATLIALSCWWRALNLLKRAVLRRLKPA